MWQRFMIFQHLMKQLIKPQIKIVAHQLKYWMENWCHKMNIVAQITYNVFSSALNRSTFPVSLYRVTVATLSVPIFFFFFLLSFVNLSYHRLHYCVILIHVFKYFMLFVQSGASL